MLSPNTKPITTASEVAKYIIAFANDVGEPITNLKLQKLLYYAQGWYLAHRGKRLFSDPIEAWVHGPAVRAIYRKYKKGWQIISEKVSRPAFTLDLKNWLDKFLEVYLSIDAFELEKMTHQEKPWIEARAGIPMDASCSNEINTDSMRSYFASLLNV